VLDCFASSNLFLLCREVNLLLILRFFVILYENHSFESFWKGMQGELFSKKFPLLFILLIRSPHARRVFRRHGAPPRVCA